MVTQTGGRQSAAGRNYPIFVKTLISEDFFCVRIISQNKRGAVITFSHHRGRYPVAAEPLSQGSFAVEAHRQRNEGWPHPVLTGATFRPEAARRPKAKNGRSPTRAGHQIPPALAGVLQQNPFSIPLGQRSLVDQQSNGSIKCRPGGGSEGAANTHSSNAGVRQIRNAHVGTDQQNIDGFRRNG
jgi:hypothetical protein